MSVGRSVPRLVVAGRNLQEGMYSSYFLNGKRMRKLPVFLGNRDGQTVKG